MYFYIKDGQRALDLSSDFILTYDPNLVSASSKKAAPRSVSNATYVKLLELGLWGKICVCYRVFKFVMFHKPDPAAGMAVSAQTSAPRGARLKKER
jgi:hypothetical protein